MSDKRMIKYDARILGRKIPLKILEGQEEQTKLLIAEINGKLADFQLKYDKVDKIDSLIMVLLSYAFDKNASDDSLLKNQLLNKMKALGEQLDS